MRANRADGGRPFKIVARARGAQMRFLNRNDGAFHHQLKLPSGLFMPTKGDFTSIEPPVRTPRCEDVKTAQKRCDHVASPVFFGKGIPKVCHRLWKMRECPPDLRESVKRVDERSDGVPEPFTDIVSRMDLALGNTKIENRDDRDIESIPRIVVVIDAGYALRDEGCPARFFRELPHERIKRIFAPFEKTAKGVDEPFRRFDRPAGKEYSSIADRNGGNRGVRVVKHGRAATATALMFTCCTHVLWCVRLATSWTKKKKLSWR